MKIITRVPAKLWDGYTQERQDSEIKVTTSDKVWRHIAITSEQDLVDLINYSIKVRSAHTVERLEWILEQVRDIPTNTTKGE